LPGNQSLILFASIANDWVKAWQTFVGEKFASERTGIVAFDVFEAFRAWVDMASSHSFIFVIRGAESCWQKSHLIFLTEYREVTHLTLSANWIKTEFIEPVASILQCWPWRSGNHFLTR
jgi:hypothetical protein